MSIFWLHSDDLMVMLKTLRLCACKYICVLLILWNKVIKSCRSNANDAELQDKEKKQLSVGARLGVYAALGVTESNSLNIEKYFYVSAMQYLVRKRPYNFIVSSKNRRSEINSLCQKSMNSHPFF